MAQSYSLVWTPAFTRAARRFLRRHRDLVDRFSEVLAKLAANPFDPSLRLHPLTGQLDGLHAVSLTFAHRITLYLHIEETEIVLVGIGSHDDVYG